MLRRGLGNRFRRLGNFCFQMFMCVLRGFISVATQAGHLIFLFLFLFHLFVVMSSFCIREVAWVLLLVFEMVVLPDSQKWLRRR